MGADGSQWYFDPAQANNLVHHTRSGFSAVAIPGNFYFPSATVDNLTRATNGNIWFAVGGALGFVTPAGQLKVVATIGQGAGGSIAFAADSTLWLATGSDLEQYSQSGALLQTVAYQANYVTQGPDGNVWFTQPDAIGSVRANGTLVVYPLTEPIAGCIPNNVCSRGIGTIATGPDGALWFVERGTTRGIGRLSPAGLLVEDPILAARSNPSDVSAGPDGKVWFVDNGAQKIGRIVINTPHRLSRSW